MHQRAYKHARGGVLIAAMSGIDIALWDLRGKMAGMPLWRLLGGTDGVCRHTPPGVLRRGEGNP